MKGEDGNDVIFTGDLSEGESDLVYGGAGGDTIYLGEITSDITTTTTSSEFNFGDLALDVTTGIIDMVAPEDEFISSVVPMAFNTLGAILGEDWGSQTETIEDATKANYAQIKDFNPLEDVVIIPLASEGDPNVSLGTGDGVNDFVFKYASNTNGTNKFGGLNFDSNFESTLDEWGVWDDSESAGDAKSFYQTSLIDTSLILDSNGVQYGGGESQEELIDRLDADFKSELSSMDGRFMILGAYSGKIIEGSSNTNYQFGTNYGDVFYAYGKGEDVVPETDEADYLYGFGGDDVFYAGGGANQIHGGDGSDTVSYEDANGNTDSTDFSQIVKGIDVDLSDSSVQVLNGFSEDTNQGYLTETDTLVSIENIIGTDLDDVIRGDSNANTFEGGKGDDVLIGRGGNDILSGGAGDDYFAGGSSNDSLIGGTGDDILVGEKGSDYLEGGADADTFRFIWSDSSVDQIADFSASEGDVIEIQASAFSGISSTSDYGSIGFSNGNLMVDGTTIATLDGVSSLNTDMGGNVVI